MWYAKKTTKIKYFIIHFQNMEFQYQFSWYPEFKGSNTVKPLSYYFTSNGVSGLVLDFAFSSAVSEHHNSLVGTANFSFWINLVFHKCLFVRATQLYFLMVPCSVVPRDNLGKRVQDSTRLNFCKTPVLAFEVRDTASPGLDPEHSKVAQRQLITCKMVFKLIAIGKGRLKS